MFVEQSHQS
uniref:Uncharacterized protein n=1 Tax=Arundo donax TaxID=35708 RepID=A0A0A8ZFC9_ARUDO